MFKLTLFNVAILLLYIMIGYVIARKKLVGEQAGKTLAALLTWVFSPLYSVSNFSKNFNIDNLEKYLIILVSGIIAVTISIIICIPLSKIFDKGNGFKRGIYKYIFAFSNNGYFGYPLVEALFGSEVLVAFMIFAMPFNVALCSYGYVILTKKDGEENSKVKLSNIFSPPLIGTIIGLTLGILPITLPEGFYKVIDPAASCFSVSAMVLVGMVLARFPFKTLFTLKKAYLINAIRLIGFPIIFFVLCYPLKLLNFLDNEVLVFTMMLSMLPIGMNVVVFPESVGHDSSEGAISCFLSYVLSLITIPIILTLIINIFGSIV